MIQLPPPGLSLHKVHEEEGREPNEGTSDPLTAELSWVYTHQREGQGAIRQHLETPTSRPRWLLWLPAKEAP